MTLSVGFRITVSLLILLPKLRGSDSYPGGTDSHRTRQPSLDAQWRLLGKHIWSRKDWYWPDSACRTEVPVLPQRTSDLLGSSGLSCQKQSHLPGEGS
jgi:hypothetical protein